LCAGNCGSLNNGAVHSGVVISRAGTVNGPLAILTISQHGLSGCLPLELHRGPTDYRWGLGSRASRIHGTVLKPRHREQRERQQFQRCLHRQCYQRQPIFLRDDKWRERKHRLT